MHAAPKISTLLDFGQHYIHWRNRQTAYLLATNMDNCYSSLPEISLLLANIGQQYCRESFMTMGSCYSIARFRSLSAIFIGFAAVIALITACDEHDPMLFESEPQLVVNPSGRVPLAAVIQFKTRLKVDATVTVTDGFNSWSSSFNQGGQAGDYSLPVLGMRPSREHQISLLVKTASGASHEQKFVYSTPKLPVSPLEFPQFTVKTAIPERMEPGITFLSVRRRALGRSHWLTEKQRKFATDWGLLMAIDARGEVVWYYESDVRTSGIDRLNNGNILMHRADSSTIEIDLLGNEVRQMYAEKRPFPPPNNPNAIAIRGLQTLHHQPHQMPNGDFLAFSANAYLVKDFPTSENDPDAPRADQMIMADTVVQLNPEGEIVWSWNSYDALDPYRIGYDTFWSYWWVRGYDQHMDWSHGNGLSYDETDDSVLVSLRNQSAILKIDHKSKEIKWILGRHDGWPERLQDKLLEPVGDLMWPGYQHNPRMTYKGTVILFDNRAHGGARPFEPRQPLDKGFSRGVEFAVDEKEMTVRQIWTSGDKQGPDACFSNAMSDAWRLPETDNHLIIYAFCLPLLEGVTQDEMDPTKRSAGDLPYGGRIEEYAGDDIVFRADFADPNDLIQWEVYGGFRSSGFY
jgi:hypothetical protein